ncbi:hypothetical protein A3F06_01400 [candidate division TM6 bacterium RIFCSPHIGHO2_12_FULL_36_22]|nr:MAG: hypothetical protein A3F06_01400 [candidate division TM6 bacterium RIFCSPHIGHO2_12_FULL_36_22]
MNKLIKFASIILLSLSQHAIGYDLTTLDGLKGALVQLGKVNNNTKYVNAVKDITGTKGGDVAKVLIDAFVQQRVDAVQNTVSVTKQINAMPTTFDVDQGRKVKVADFYTKLKNFNLDDVIKVLQDALKDVKCVDPSVKFPNPNISEKEYVEKLIETLQQMKKKLA